MEGFPQELGLVSHSRASRLEIEAARRSGWYGWRAGAPRLSFAHSWPHVTQICPVERHRLPVRSGTIACHLSDAITSSRATTGGDYPDHRPYSLGPEMTLVVRPVL